MPDSRGCFVTDNHWRVSGVGVDVSGVGFLIHDIELSRGLWVLDKVILGWLRRKTGVLPYPGAQNGAY